MKPESGGCCGPPAADSLLYEVVEENEKREVRLSWAHADIYVAFWETDAYSESNILYYPTYEAAIAAAREWLESGAVLRPKVSWWRRLFG